MGIELYQNMTSDSIKELGVKLPTLQSGNLNIESFQGDFTSVEQAISLLQPTDGWVMYRDKIEISANLPRRKDVIEAEYHKDEISLKVQLLHGNVYQVTRLHGAPSPDGSLCFSEQKVLLRNQLLTEGDFALYRLWYESVNCRWQPIAQQFVGFIKEAN
ncbi:hypothetical protein BCU93_03365 [Vibrio breoganii]|uniref:hypothetical protein n=1 Tax=Vibrio breoganii TaxID=553239 RepID=UPI000C81C72A|nr:hypothetical protein [Vibrio breoganii]PMG33891.1 hypothetical protein BCU93_03365 [Vibrio breoganii]